MQTVDYSVRKASMQATNAPKIPYRPQIKRMTKKEINGTGSSNDFDSSSVPSTHRSQNKRPSQMPSEIYPPWRPREEPPRNMYDDEKNKPFIPRKWFWIFGAIFCFILLIAIVGIVLGIVLPMTTTAAPDSNTTPSG